MKKYLALLLFSVTFLINAQEYSKKYRYVIVPIQYGFSSKPNQFQLNVLTRVYLKKAGFEVYMNEGETLPQELGKNSCLALNANVLKDGGLFKSVLTFQLKDCFGKVVFESKGESRIKAYKEAYKEALTIALEDFLFESSSYVLKSGETPYAEKLAEDKIENTPEETRPFKEVAIKYTFETKTYWLLKKGDDYELYEDEGDTIHATLSKADRGTYAYDSELIDGAAYFNPNGDLMVEYLSKGEVDVQELSFKKQ